MDRSLIFHFRKKEDGYRYRVQNDILEVSASKLRVVSI